MMIATDIKVNVTTSTDFWSVLAAFETGRCCDNKQYSGTV